VCVCAGVMHLTNVKAVTGVLVQHICVCVYSVLKLVRV
jgi:hypothetical protein